MDIGRQHARIEVEGWATPAPGVTLTELVEEMKALGNPVLAIDVPNNRLKLLHVQQEGLLG